MLKDALSPNVLCGHTVQGEIHPKLEGGTAWREGAQNLKEGRAREIFGLLLEKINSFFY